MIVNFCCVWEGNNHLRYHLGLSMIKIVSIFKIYIRKNWSIRFCLRRVIEKLFLGGSRVQKLVQTGIERFCFLYVFAQFRKYKILNLCSLAFFHAFQRIYIYFISWNQKKNHLHFFFCSRLVVITKKTDDFSLFFWKCNKINLSTNHIILFCHFLIFFLIMSC